MLKLFVSAAVGILVFVMLEIWLINSPFEVRKFIFQQLMDLPGDTARWLFTNTKDIDQLAHYLFITIAFAVTAVAAVISLAFPSSDKIPASE